jgi:hypothetical protein
MNGRRLLLDRPALAGAEVGPAINTASAAEGDPWIGP